MLTKGVLERVPPLPLLVVQLLASNAVIWSVRAARGAKLPPARRAIRLGLAGVLEPGLAYTFGVLGLALSRASNYALLGTLETLFIILLAWPLLHERVRPSFMGLVGLALAGVGLIVLNGGREAHGSGTLAGDLLILAGASCAALYVVMSRRMVAEVEPLPLLALQQLFGLLWALLAWSAAALLGVSGEVGHVSLSTWAWVAVSGIVQYALAFWFYLVALKGIPASSASLFLTLIPIFGVGGAYLFLGERMAPWQWAGASLVLMTIAGMSRQQAHEAAPASQEPVEP